MEDPYQILGVPRTATEAELRSAYRKLAKQHHPDVNPGKPEAAERFKAIASAYDLLSDAEKRGKFDRGEIDASGAEVQPERPYWRDYAENPGARANPQYSGGYTGSPFGNAQYGGSPFDSESGFDPEDLEDLLSRSFGGRGGRDAQYSLTVDFLDAAKGATRRITLPTGRTLDVAIPPGTRDGQVLRLKGLGNPGRGKDAKPGDALVEISVAPHPFFRREGNDVLLELPVTLQEAVLGATVEVPTIGGRVKLNIPANSADGAKLRMRGRGIAGGNQIVALKVVLPSQPEPGLAEFLRGWKPEHPFDPRAAMGGS